MSTVDRHTVQKMNFAEVLKGAQSLASKDLNAARRWFYDKLKALPAEERINNLYRVAAKDGRAVRFRMNSQQKKYWELNKDNHFTLILKSRQIGFTTFSCVRAYDKALFESGSRCGIMAHKVPNVQQIFKIVRRLHEFFVEDWAQWLPISTSGDSRVALEIDAFNSEPPIPIKSSVVVSHDFKGFTLNFLHFSEAAFTEKERITEALQCVPYNGWCVWETTPNGMGGAFYDAYQDAKKGRGEYKRFFAPWFEFYPEPDAPIADKVDGQFTLKEQDLRTRFDVSDKAIIWRRNKIASLGGDEDEFERLYPSDEDLCFLSGENQVFPQYLLSALHKRIKDPLIGELIDKGGRLEFNPDDAGRFLVWDKPSSGHYYVIGMDCSEGVGQDATVAYVKDRISGRYVACLYGQLDVDEAAECCIKLAKFYNYAHVCPEINNHGHAVVENMKRRQWHKFYRRRAIDHTTNEPSRIIGFCTTKAEKHRIIQNLKVALRDGRARPQDGLLLKEMTVFFCDENGKMAAKSGEHDDRVMAAALTEEMDAALPPPQDDTLSNLPERRYDPITGFPID